MQKQSVSNLEVKKINRNQIYRLICHHDRISKPEIAAALGISMPTVLQNVSELIERGLIAEVGSYESTGGRKAKVLSPVNEARHAIGIDITQNHIGLALTDISGNVLSHSRQYKPYANEAGYYRELGDLAMNFLSDVNRPVESFLGFGISIPGIISLDNATIAHSHALHITNIPCKLFTQHIPFPCVFTNDANAAMIAELYHHTERLTAVYLSLSNSVGGSIFTEKVSEYEHQPVYKNLFLGDNCRSGEFGHMTLYPGGTTCYCGKPGCVDSYCSAKVLANHTDGKLEKFFDAVTTTIELKNLWEAYLDHLAIAVNSIRMAFDCQVIIGGYVGSFIEPYLVNLQDRAARLNTFESDASYIKPCKFKFEASALGAALRLIENFVLTI